MEEVQTLLKEAKTKKGVDADQSYQFIYAKLGEIKDDNLREAVLSSWALASGNHYEQYAHNFTALNHILVLVIL